MEAHFGEITPGQQDYSEKVAELDAAQIEVLFFGGYTAEAALLRVRRMIAAMIFSWSVATI